MASGSHANSPASHCHPPAQIAIPLLTLPPQHFWVGPENTHILLCHSLSQLKPVPVYHYLTLTHRYTSGLFGKTYISHKTGVCVCRRVSGNAPQSALGFPDPAPLAYFLHLFSMFLLVDTLTASLQRIGLFRALQ